MRSRWPVDMALVLAMATMLAPEVLLVVLIVHRGF